MQDDASNGLTEPAKAGLSACQQHAAAALAPWYLHWQARCAKLLHPAVRFCKGVDAE